LFFHFEVNAFAFALALLRAHAAAYGGESAGEFEHASSVVNVAALHVFDECGDVDVYGATLHASGLGAVEATSSFVHSLVKIKTLSYLFVACDAVGGVEFVHRGARDCSALFGAESIAELNAPIGVARCYIFNLFVSHNRE
jgi:hypothetical protein